MASPLVSVLISVYNAGEYLRESVLSIVDQTYENTEIIIIDDGSTDNCLDYIADVEDGRISVLRQPNSGKAVALNRALEVAKGEFYVIQDADDVSYPERIDRQVRFMLENPEVAGVFTGYDMILGKKRFAPRFRAKNQNECREDIEQFRMPSHDPTVMFRLSSVKGFRYHPELRIGQGHDYILKVGEKNHLAVLGECLYSYRCNFKSNTRRNIEKRKAMVEKVIEKAKKRRGGGGSLNILGSNLIHREKEHGLVPHLMESVLDLRREGRRFKAFQVGAISIGLHPTDLYYYKPFAYAIMPVALINKYRKYKTNVMFF